MSSRCADHFVKRCPAILALIASCCLACAAVVIHAAELSSEGRSSDLPATSNAVADCHIASPLTPPVLPDGLGVNIHFTEPKLGEMEMLVAGGFRWVRMDLSWGATERVKGQYDFSRYDVLMQTLVRHGMRALLILDYSNEHYDQGLSPYTDEGRLAFARWAAAAVSHFRGQRVLWEMYNEPNIRFWKPEPNVEHYVKLALEVGRAIRDVSREEIYIGPATSQIDLSFLEGCFKAELLEYWSAVSVHPYRSKGPETVATEYAALRRLIDKYAPAGKQVPIISGEWGYTSVSKERDETVQGKYLPRQWLVNLANDVPLSIWYDWHDDGPDPNEREHHFGTVFHRYHAGRQPVYDPKPAYQAAKTLATALAGFRFNKRLHVGRDDVHVLLFENRGDLRLAAWTTAADGCQAVIPCSPGRFQVTSYLGETLPPVSADVQGLHLALNDAPQYLVPEAPNDVLRLAATWQRVPQELRHSGGEVKVALGVTNPLSRPIRVTLPGGSKAELKPGARLNLNQRFTLLRSLDPLPLNLSLAVEGMPPLAQQTQGLASNPLALSLGLIEPQALTLLLDNPSGESLAAAVRLKDVEGMEIKKTEMPVNLSPGQDRGTVRFPRHIREGKLRFAAEVLDAEGRALLELPAASYVPVDDFSRYTVESLPEAYRVAPDGDRNVTSEQSVALADPPAGAPVPLGRCLKIDFHMQSGWKFLRLVPPRGRTMAVEGRPSALAMWVYLDGDGVSPRARTVDASGQTFQPSAAALRTKGWQRLVIDLRREPLSHWGGANDGVMHAPLRWDSLLLLDKLHRDAVCKGTVYVTAPVLVY